MFEILRVFIFLGALCILCVLAKVPVAILDCTKITCLVKRFYFKYNSRTFEDNIHLTVQGVDRLRVAPHKSYEVSAWQLGLPEWDT